jgi:hypothetical protein
MNVTIGHAVEFRDTRGRLFATYHYDDPFKSFFRGLCTPQGGDVVAPPPAGHPHHKGLQYGLCLSDVNFWEEARSSEPADRQLPIGRQQTESLAATPPGEDAGFTQEIVWRTDAVPSFRETRKITVTEMPGAYVWTWRTTLVAERNVKILPGVWPGPGYCGLGLRLSRALFEQGAVSPPGTRSGSTPTSVTFLGKGAQVRFGQDATQADVLFVSYYRLGDGFAFMSLGPTNDAPRSLRQGESLDRTYVVTVADR